MTEILPDFSALVSSLQEGQVATPGLPGEPQAGAPAPGVIMPPTTPNVAPPTAPQGQVPGIPALPPEVLNDTGEPGGLGELLTSPGFIAGTVFVAGAMTGSNPQESFANGLMSLGSAFSEQQKVNLASASQEREEEGIELQRERVGLERERVGIARESEKAKALDASLRTQLAGSAQDMRKWETLLANATDQEKLRLQAQLQEIQKTTAGNKNRTALMIELLGNQAAIEAAQIGAASREAVAGKGAAAQQAANKANDAKTEVALYGHMQRAWAERVNQAAISGLPAPTWDEFRNSELHWMRDKLKNLTPRISKSIEERTVTKPEEFAEPTLTLPQTENKIHQLAEELGMVENTGVVFGTSTRQSTFNESGRGIQEILDSGDENAIRRLHTSLTARLAEQEKPQFGAEATALLGDAPTVKAAEPDKAAVPTVNSKADVDALPSGASFIWGPTGLQGTKK